MTDGQTDRQTHTAWQQRLRLHKSKNRHFTTFVSPGDASGAITLNVVWMEREFDAYKLSRWMYPSNYNCFSDRARYWSKIVFFHTPVHSTPPLGGSRRNITTPFGVEKLEWCGYPILTKISKISLFVLAQLTNVTDRRTDTACRHNTAPMHMHRAVNIFSFFFFAWLWLWLSNAVFTLPLADSSFPIPSFVFFYFSVFSCLLNTRNFNSEPQAGT